MPYKSDFTELKQLEKPIEIQTADKRSKTYITHAGVVLIKHTNENNVTQITKLEPVFYQPHSPYHLLSQGSILRHGYYAYADEKKTSLRFKSNHKVFMTCYPMNSSDALHWLKTEVVKSKIDLFKDFIPKNIRIPKNLIAHKTIDYDIWHCCLGHPSKDVLRHASEATGGFPKVNIPNEDKDICPGCDKGKMTQH